MLNGFNTKIPSLISRLGRSVLVRTYANTGTSYDPTLTPTDAPATAAVFDYEASELFGSVIQREDKLILISSLSVVAKTDKIVDGGTEYTIVNLEKVGPGDETFYYRIQGRV